MNSLRKYNPNHVKKAKIRTKIIKETRDLYEAIRDFNLYALEVKQSDLENLNELLVT